MEVPEIIWLSPNEYRSNEPSCFWSESQRTDYDIEYIRKDAFIEKATEWLCYNYDKYIISIGSCVYPAYTELCKDFQKAMEE